MIPITIALFAALAALPAQDVVPVVKRVGLAVAMIDRAAIEDTVRTLVGFGTRHVLSRTDSDTQGTGAARRWLQRRYEEIAAASGGRLTVELQSATVPCARPGMPREVPIVNVIATLRGTTDPGRIYVVGGHYDSRNSNGADGEGVAPGAVDDASGTAVAMEACRVLSLLQFPATVIFVAYDGEEQGLLGSAAHAKALAEAGAEVDGMITCDIVGNTLGMDGARYDRHLRCFSYAASGNDSLGRSLARAATYAATTHVKEFGVELIFRGDRYGRGGDHRSFFEQGFPAVRFTEPREDFSRQHQDVVVRDGRRYGDLPDYADFDYMAKVTQVVVATLTELASAPRAPLVLSAQLRRDRYDTELVFQMPPGVERCEFVWRKTTEPDWTGVVDMRTAGLETVRNGRLRGTLPGVCLDDVVVGVRSIGADGSRSRVATPQEPDRFDQRRAATNRERAQPESGK
ncbi:MAG: M28 family peptidase [Planctomycetes bacterium]|nr:M28 family peptidase [Planctomycetota bacterium]MCB9884696.1 M28 family peptidase [Planctomycetota bacterium]